TVGLGVGIGVWQGINIYHIGVKEKYGLPEWIGAYGSLLAAVLAPVAAARFSSTYAAGLIRLFQKGLFVSSPKDSIYPYLEGWIRLPLPTRGVPFSPENAGAPGPQRWTADLSPVTGKGAAARNRAIEAIILEDFPDL